MTVNLDSVPWLLLDLIKWDKSDFVAAQSRIAMFFRLEKSVGRGRVQIIPILEGSWMRAFELRYVRRLMAIIGTALSLSACEVRPLYGPTAMGVPLADELQAISVEPIPDRMGHYVKNELIFALNGESSDVPPRFNLQVKLKERVQSPIIDTVTGRATSATVITDAEYKLTAMATNKEVTSGTVMAVASYDRFSNRLANVRAARDGEIRDAKTIADQIRVRISIAMAYRDPAQDKDMSSSQDTKPAPLAPKNPGTSREK